MNERKHQPRRHTSLSLVDQPGTQRTAPIKLLPLFWRGLMRAAIGFVAVMLIALFAVVVLMLTLDDSPDQLKAKIDRSFWSLTLGFWLLVAVGFVTWPRLCQVIAKRWGLDAQGSKELIDTRWTLLGWILVLEAIFAFDQVGEAIRILARYF